MVESFASAPDILRLVAVPVLGWAAWQDHRTRRVPRLLWWPLIGLGVLLLVWDGWTAANRPPPAGRLFLIRAGLSVGVLVPLAAAFHRLHLVGAADAKAFAALAVLFPTYPTYELLGTVFPVVRPTLGVFSLTAITNGAILGLLYPAVLAAGNLLDGEWSPAMVRARRVTWTALPEAHGRLAEGSDGRTFRGLDLDALRMYLRWRDRTLVDLKEHPDELRDPSTVPDDPADPTDGRLDPAERLDPERPVDPPDSDANPFEFADDWDYEDPWAAEEFVATVGPVYGTTAAKLRDGLELLSRADRVWVSPGLPYLVPVFAGLVLGLVYGDLLFAAIRLAGLG